MQNPVDYRPTSRTVHKNYNLNERLRFLVVNSSDTNVIEYKGSTNFKITLPEDLKGQDQKNIDTVSFYSGVIPNVLNANIVPVTSLRPHLFLKIEELESNVISNNIPGKATSLIRYNFNNTETGQFLETMEYNPMDNEYVGKGKSDTLTFKIYSSTGVLYDFGNSFYTTAFITPGNPTTIDIGPHTLQIGDLVYFRGLTNGSNITMNNVICRADPWLITAVGATTIVIGALDTTGQAPNQVLTGSPQPFVLGGNTKITDLTNYGVVFGLSFSNANPTIVTTNIPHGFSNGDLITATGFDNGTSSFINGLINKQNFITVLTPTTFSIPVDLTSQAVAQPLTGTPLPFPFGRGMLVLDAKKQVTFHLALTINYNDYPIN